MMTATAMNSYFIPLSLVIIAITATGSGPGPGPFALTSSGDRSDKFQWCQAKCTWDACLTANSGGGGHLDALALCLTRWTCMDEFKYVCTHQEKPNLIISLI
jgi:hypothetical protein